MNAEANSDPGFRIFKTGETVADRYVIVRFIARGGVAEVYEARDQELRSSLALKAIRREHGTNARTIERFKREINLARQVTHPNVSRIYEFGAEQRGGEDVLFLTMELLEGVTLHQRIEEEGPLDAARAMPLARQMAAGLAAAGRAGVVHRDFKSGNVMLVAASEAGGGERVVITDFGMARVASGGSESRIVTHEDLVVGSPAYMAPEQIEDGPLTPATDVYAFGVVLYEMVTGRFPFEAETALATALMRLNEPPPPPRRFAPDLDARWNRTILRCLERDPGRRFASASEVVAALTPEAPGDRRERDGERRVPALVAVAVGGALIAAGWAWLPKLVNRDPAAPSVAPPAATETVAARPSVAVLGFRNLAGHEDDAWLSTALSEMLATEVAAGERLRLVPGENVARTRIELGLAGAGGLAAGALASGSLDAGTLARLGEILGADLTVAGSYLLAGADREREIRLDLEVRDVASGETVARLSERGNEARVFDLVEAAGRALRASLGVGDLSPADAAAVRAAMPAGPEAARLYAQGLEKLRRYDARGALELFQAAVRIDPENPLIHSALSAAWGSLGYRPKARDEAREAFELAGELGRRDRMWVEARYREIAGQRRQAVDLYRRLWDDFPDNLEIGLRLVSGQISIDQGQAALETVERLRALPGAAGTDPRLDLAEAEAARTLSQYQHQQRAASRAATKSESLGARLQLARAREVEAGAWRDLGEPEKAMAAYGQAREIYQAANNRGRVARVLISEAKIHRYQGRFDQARALNEQALEVAREIGDQGSIKHALNILAIILRERGRLSEALGMHELELVANREIGDRRSVQIALTSAGVVQRLLGDLGGAAGRFSEALAQGRESGNQRGIEINLNMLGEVLVHQGRPASARRLFEEALTVNQDTRSPRGKAYYVSNLADVDLAAGDLEAARRGHEEALAIRRELGEKTNVAFSRLALGRLALEEGRLDDAAQQAREAAAELEGVGQGDAEADALSLLALVRLAQGRSEQAAAEAERAAALLEASENSVARLRVATRVAEVAAATGDREGALRALERTLDEARRLGFVDLGLEADLALGRVEIAAGDRAAGVARLEAVAKRAGAFGFELIAGEARSAVRDSYGGPGDG